MIVYCNEYYNVIKYNYKILSTLEMFIIPPYVTALTSSTVRHPVRYLHHRRCHSKGKCDEKLIHNIIMQPFWFGTDAK
jgi:hypothetical protein